MNALLALLAFGLSAGEEWIAARRTQAIAAGQARAAAWWSGVFDAVLFVDVWLIVSRWWLVVPIVLGSALGCYWAVRGRSGDSLRGTPPSPLGR